MKIVAMNTKIDDVKDIAEMIYYTDKFLAQLIFGHNKNSVISTLCRLIERGNNFFGYENVNLIVDEGKILGYYIGFQVSDAHNWSVTRSYISTMSYSQLARYIIYGRKIINQLLISHMNQDDYYLSNMYVKPASRNNGVGSLMLRHVITDALRLGCKRIVLEVSSENKARFLYTRLGFKEVDRKQASIMRQLYTVVHMEYTV
jgi:ribosomal protein S18 acetylase RimI-like enzyme